MNPPPNRSGLGIVQHAYDLGMRIWARLLSLTGDGNPFSVHSLMAILAFIGVRFSPRQKIAWQSFWKWLTTECDGRYLLDAIVMILFILFIMQSLSH